MHQIIIRTTFEEMPDNETSGVQYEVQKTEGTSDERALVMSYALLMHTLRNVAETSPAFAATLTKDMLDGIKNVFVRLQEKNISPMQ